MDDRDRLDRIADGIEAGERFGVGVGMAGDVPVVIFGLEGREDDAVPMTPETAREIAQRFRSPEGFAAGIRAVGDDLDAAADAIAALCGRGGG